MKNVAKSYVAQHTGFLKQRGVLMSTQKKALSTAGSPDPAISAQLKALKAQDDALIQNQITQLKTGLGTARFQMFDSFVRQSVTKDVHWGPLTPAASSKKQ